MSERQKIGNISTKDIWAFIFKCLGIILFPILLFMPLIIIWRIFFYEPKDFWLVIKFGFLYTLIITFYVWLSCVKTLLEYDDENLYIITKKCFLFNVTTKQILISDIDQITFADITKETPKWKEILKKVFKLKLTYAFIYKIGTLLINRNQLLTCIIYNKQKNILKITDIKKNDERYIYLHNLKNI